MKIAQPPPGEAFLIDEPNQSAAKENEINPIPPNKRDKGIDGIDGWRSPPKPIPHHTTPCGGVLSGFRSFFCLPIGEAIPLNTWNRHCLGPVRNRFFRLWRIPFRLACKDILSSRCDARIDQNFIGLDTGPSFSRESGVFASSYDSVAT